ncbi:purine phosphorylase [Sphaerisporangium krabiense]|uniref:8-oxo-dGTP diphosphatase n=1 Tax=Sphaerisporangium krabiense TaxID=763782 RepID=A0A7W8Z1T7_9ACTN|nr:5'-methylthioadenosine/S-adenosylhomocysteine nucleosidase [Sphaerisporangium krabiense]MBB5625603.1 8-oxo-dGTP diphosphatase [Sphaerisporangium krabiense]GII63063.1 purine phosphorylase [Sphaerisporangium krabiense]
MNERPVVILTALDLEYEAVRRHLSDLRLHRHRAGTRFEIGRLPNGCHVALGLVGKGNQPAAVLTERAITEFDPFALLFVGVAGALWPDVDLGDVVIATHVYAYHGGTSEDDGLKARPRVWEISHEPDQIARHLVRNGTWKRRLPADQAAAEVRFGPIAAGEVVQDSAISAHAQWVRQTYNDALAIEMEAAGVAQAAHLNRSLPMVVIRGISDRADGTKVKTDGVGWQAKAVTNAAALALALAEELARETLRGNVADRTEKAEGESMPEIVRNVAKGSAHVGVQAGRIYGNVSIGQPSQAVLDPAGQLADLRHKLSKACAAGDVDVATFTAAEEEIDVAAQSLSENTDQGKNKAMIALRRLRGLLMDVADLASKVASVIAAIRGTL